MGRSAAARARRRDADEAGEAVASEPAGVGCAGGGTSGMAGFREHPNRKKDPENLVALCVR